MAFTITGIFSGFPPLILTTISDLKVFGVAEKKETLNASFESP